MRHSVGITVVVPSFNHGRFIDESIRSLLEQNYCNLQIIVMDGGSTDDTIDRLKAFGDRIRWISEPDEGQSHAIIKGFALSSDPWLAWLNSDDIQCNRALWRVDECVSADPSVGVVVGRGHYMDADGINPRDYPTIDLGAGTDPAEGIFERGYMAQPSVFFARSLYERVGGINRSLQFCMDYELWARFALAGAKFAAIDADISGNRWYESTKTSGQTLDLYAEIVATQQRLFGKVSSFYVQAVSDFLYSKFHSRFFGDRGHLFYRWIYFKAMWLALNARAPQHCATGLLRHTIAKSGPVIGDRMTWRDWRDGALKAIRTAWP